MLQGEERISVGGGVVTLDNDGTHASSIHTEGFPSGIYDIKVETKSRWVGRDYGHNGNFYFYTQRHYYCWYGDGFYLQYGFTRDGDRVLLPNSYTPVMNEWTTFSMEKKGNKFYMYHYGELKHTYTESDDAPDELVRVAISCGWISTMEYDYVSLRETAPPSPVGGKATPINIPLNRPETPILWIWLKTIILSLALTVVYVKKRKRNTETGS